MVSPESSRVSPELVDPSEGGFPGASQQLVESFSISDSELESSSDESSIKSRCSI